MKSIEELLNHVEGLKHAYPYEINEHLGTLQKYANECKTIAEFGVGIGTSTWAFLSTSPEKFRSYDILDLKLDEIKNTAKELDIDWEFTVQDTGHKDFHIEPCDLLFIDSFHSGEHLEKELANNAEYVSKYIILHDTEKYGEWGQTENGDYSPNVRGLNWAINKFVENSLEWIAHEKFYNNHGLTILKRLPKGTKQHQILDIDLTIVVIDSLNYKASELAIQQTKKIFPLAKTLIFSDKKFTHCDKFIEVEKFDYFEHSRICLQEVGKYLETEWALFIQYDGFPTNPNCWTDEFLLYDYIGSPFKKPDRMVVGNGGFSLRNKRLLELTPFCPQVNDGDVGMLEDQVISFSSREWLESQGIKYAPVELSKKFSTTEELGMIPSFGFHGHHLVPYFMGRDLTYKWLESVDLDHLLYTKNIYTFPYYLWKWGDENKLREWFLHADKVNAGWHRKCFEECTWRIPLLFPDQDIFELQKMITVYGYTGP